jgi:large subunit ribosomal protein L2
MKKRKNKKTISKSLRKILRKHAGRNASGKITLRHRGGRHKRFWRKIGFRRSKRSVTGEVRVIEYDPNRTAPVALVNYQDGRKGYILAPAGLRPGDKVAGGEEAEVEIGNTVSLGRLPVGTLIYNLELVPGKGAQLVRGAGVAALLMAKEDKVVTVKLPSGEIRMVSGDCLATIGQVGRVDWKSEKIGSAGRKRRRGIRPTVRGVAQNPNTHPHGGGEGRSGIGMPGPKTPWGQPALGKKTRKKKASDQFIIKRRK